MTCKPVDICVIVQVVDSKLSLDTAMSLYGLEHSELFWEKRWDTKLLLAWNRNTFVVAFRGTASCANALADVQVSSLCLKTALDGLSQHWAVRCACTGLLHSILGRPFVLIH